jgi:hypothetical protein
VHRIAIIASEIRVDDDIVFQERVTLDDLYDPHISRQLLERLAWGLETAGGHQPGGHHRAGQPPPTSRRGR